MSKANIDACRSGTFNEIIGTIDRNCASPEWRGSANGGGSRIKPRSWKPRHSATGNDVSDRADLAEPVSRFIVHGPTFAGSGLGFDSTKGADAKGAELA